MTGNRFSTQLRKYTHPSGTWLLIALGAIVLILGGGAFSTVWGDEPSGLVVAAAIEEATAAAIARAEKSVVSVARVADKGNPAADLQPDFMGRPRLATVPGPHDIDFVPSGFATGVVVGKGLVLTNHHVLALDEQSRFYITTPSRKVYSARIRGADSYSDLAVLEIAEPAPAEEFTPITFGDAAPLRKGQFVIALGNPYAIARDGQASASWGIISNLQRKAPPQQSDNNASVRPTLQHFGALIQTDAKLNLGTSGGALINLKGEMIGLTTALAAVAGYEQAAGYALPVDASFRETVEKLKSGEESTHGLLGIEIHRNDELTIKGVRVGRIFEGGPAGQAGIRANDVIVRVDDQPIRDPDDLMLTIGRLPAGRRTRIIIERDGRLQERQLTLAKFPVTGRQVVTNPAPPWRGATVDFFTPLIEVAAGRVAAVEAPRRPSVMVRDVVEGSPSWEAGLRRGMLITHVDGTAVETPDDFRAAVAGKDGDLTLDVLGGKPKSAKITVSKP